MTADQGAGINRPTRADLAENRSHLLDKQLDQITRAVVPKRSQGPQKSLACKGGLCTERNRAHDIEPRSNAAVKHHRRTFADCTAYCRKRIDRGGQPFHLSA